MKTREDILSLAVPAPREPNSPEEWELELRAFDGANNFKLPDDVRTLIADLWAEIVEREHWYAAPTPPAAEAKGLEPVAWVPEDELPASLPTAAYNFLFEHSRVDGIRWFPIFSAPPTYADAEAKGFERGIEAAADAVKRAGERVACLETPAMRGDNLAICLCTHFDDGGDNDGDTGWSTAATDGYDEVMKAIRDHYAAAIRSLASPAPKGET